MMTLYIQILHRDIAYGLLTFGSYYCFLYTCVPRGTKHIY